MSINKFLGTTAIAGVVWADGALAQQVSFDDIDLNDDGELSRTELVATFGSEGADTVLLNQDLDSDGVLTEDEARGISADAAETDAPIGEAGDTEPADDDTGLRGSADGEGGATDEGMAGDDMAGDGMDDGSDDMADDTAGDDATGDAGDDGTAGGDDMGSDDMGGDDAAIDDAAADDSAADDGVADDGAADDGVADDDAADDSAADDGAADDGAADDGAGDDGGDTATDG